MGPRPGEEDDDLGVEAALRAYDLQRGAPATSDLDILDPVPSSLRAEMTPEVAAMMEQHLARIAPGLARAMRPVDRLHHMGAPTFNEVAAPADAEAMAGLTTEVPGQLAMRDGTQSPGAPQAAVLPSPASTVGAPPTAPAQSPDASPALAPLMTAENATTPLPPMSADDAAYTAPMPDREEARSHEMIGAHPAVVAEADPFDTSSRHPETGAALDAPQPSPMRAKREGGGADPVGDARTQDTIMQALGNIAMGFGTAAAGPLGLPDRAGLERQIAGLGGAEAGTRADEAALQARKDAGAQQGQARADRGAQDRRAQEEQLRREQVTHSESELTRRSNEGIAGIRANTQAVAQHDLNERAAGTQAGENARQERAIAAREDLARLQAELRHHAGRGGGAMSPEQHTRLVNAATALGLTPEQAVAEFTLGGRRGLARAGEAAGRASNTRENVEARQAGQMQNWREQHGVDAQGRVPIMPNAGVYSTNVAVAQGPEGMKAREAISDARVVYDALGTIDRISQSSNPADPTLVDQLAGARSTLLASMGRAQNFGVLSDSEKQRILDAIPNPQSARQWALGTGRTVMASHRASAEARLRSQLATAGVDEDGIAHAIRFVRTGAQNHPAAGAAQPPRPGWVRVRRTSDGRTGWRDPSLPMTGYEAAQ